MECKAKQAFENWYGSGLTKKQYDVMFEVSNSGYVYMATRLAYQAFKAGWEANS